MCSSFGCSAETCFSHGCGAVFGETGLLAQVLGRFATKVCFSVRFGAFPLEDLLASVAVPGPRLGVVRGPLITL